MFTARAKFFLEIGGVGVGEAGFFRDWRLSCEPLDTCLQLEQKFVFCCAKAKVVFGNV
jgi:hypothetical protein